MSLSSSASQGSWSSSTAFVHYDHKICAEEPAGICNRVNEVCNLGYVRRNIHPWSRIGPKLGQMGYPRVVPHPNGSTSLGNIITSRADFSPLTYLSSTMMKQKPQRHEERKYFPGTLPSGLFPGPLLRLHSNKVQQLMPYLERTYVVIQGPHNWFTDGLRSLRCIVPLFIFLEPPPEVLKAFLNRRT